MNTYMCSYICVFILLYKYDDNIIQKSICTNTITIILLFVFEFVYLLRYVYLDGTSYANYL